MMTFLVAVALFLLCGTANAATQLTVTTPTEELWRNFDQRLSELEKQQKLIKLNMYKWISTFQTNAIDQQREDGSFLFDEESFKNLFDPDTLHSIESDTAALKAQHGEVVLKSDTSRLTRVWPHNAHKEYCSSFTNAYTDFIPVNGTSFKFKVRARYDATIGFASKAWEKPVYDIMIGDYANSKTNLYKDRYLVQDTLTPGILDPCEFRGFWVSWENNIIRVGRQGNPTPVVTYPVESLQPVNFIGIRTTIHSMGDWII